MMITDRYKSFYLIMAVLAIFISNSDGNNETTIKTHTEKYGSAPEPRALFSPRVDYNEWMPVGRGDPLKKDPTYDYSPPVLDRVRYWGDRDTNKDKKEILLLGVTSKRQSHKKDPKYTSIRRHYIPNLPTRLMPPPMQTLSPNLKHSSTETYQGIYYSTPSTYNRQTNHYWNHNKNINNYSDAHTDESVNYVSISRPNSNVINNGQNTQRKPWLQTLLQKEVTKPAPTYIQHQSESLFESHSTLSSPTKQSIQSYSNFVTSSTETPTYFQPTIPPVTVSPISMTTDSLFSHYKQSSQPLQGPMYLIIEGHSKVKTYGLKDNITTKEPQAKIVPVPGKDDPIIKHVVSQDDNGQNFIVKHLHKIPNPNKTNIETKNEESGMKNFLSLLDKSLGNFFLTDIANENSIKSNKTILKIDDTDIERESRQIFDYDQLPESELNEDEDGNFRVTDEPKSSSDFIIEHDSISKEMT